MTRPDPFATHRCRPVLALKREWMLAPRHIVRIDHGHTHGWQVRYRAPSRFFSDSGRSPRASLGDAKTYLAGIYRGEHKRTRRGRGFGGVRIVRDKRGQWYAEATHPRRGQSPRRYYFGVDRTRTAARERKALARAHKQREQWLSTCAVPRR